MPGKRPSVKNEKQYEKLKDEGNVEGARGEDRELARRLKPWREGVRFRHPAPQPVAGRHDRTEEGRGPQGRPRHRTQDVLGTQNAQGRLADEAPLPRVVG